jgi:O-methyltransferase
MLERAMDFVRHNGVSGDYFEFGVYAGTTFQYAYHSAMARGLVNMRFHALDSFEGFSQPKGHDDIGHVTRGGRFCSKSQFLDNIRRSGVPLSKVDVTKGWFSDSLEAEGAKKTNKKLGDTKAGVVWFDADLFEPTLSSLNFITDRLQDGSVIIFDNWFLFKGHPGRGERKAFDEWRKKNPHILLTPFYHFGWHGTSFIVNLPLTKEE